MLTVLALVLGLGGGWAPNACQVTGGAPNVRALNGRLYRWSPDGRSIVFVKNEGKKENLYLSPLAGGEPKAITSFADGSIANFAWSPDGNRIVLTHYLQTRDVVLLNAR